MSSHTHGSQRLRINFHPHLEFGDKRFSRKTAAVFFPGSWLEESGMVMSQEEGGGDDYFADVVCADQR